LHQAFIDFSTSWSYIWTETQVVICTIKIQLSIELHIISL